MSRIEENKRLCDLWNNLSFTGSKDQVEVKIWGAQTNFLMDISKSLAIIADLAAKEEDDGK